MDLGKKIDCMRLFYSIQLEMNTVRYYQEKLEQDSSSVFFVFTALVSEGCREPALQGQRNGFWWDGKGYERVFVSEDLRRKWIRRFKAKYKKALDAVKYDSEKLAKILFGPGYLE